MHQRHDFELKMHYKAFGYQTIYTSEPVCASGAQGGAHSSISVVGFRGRVPGGKGGRGLEVVRGREGREWMEGRGGGGKGRTPHFCKEIARWKYLQQPFLVNRCLNCARVGRRPASVVRYGIGSSQK